MRLISVGEVVVAEYSYYLQLLVHAPVVLGEEVSAVLLACIALRTCVVQIVVHEVGAYGKDVATHESVVVEQA